MSNPFRYVGKYGVQTDADDLLYMRARYYKPSIGRFINKDPIGLAGGINLYRYVLNNPLKFIDPLGLETKTPPIDEVYENLPESVQNVTSALGAGAQAMVDYYNVLGVCEAVGHYYKDAKPNIKNRMDIISGAWDESNPAAQSSEQPTNSTSQENTVQNNTQPSYP